MIHSSRSNRSASTAVPGLRPSAGRRGGAVIIVVLSLLTTLLVLGLFFHSWTSQERATAEFFGNTDPMEIDPDPIFDFGLKQVITNTDQNYRNSALYGNRWSMLAHIIGALNGDGTPADIIPHNGRGITVRINPSLIDQDSDGIPDWRDNFDTNGTGVTGGGYGDGHIDITDVAMSMGSQPSFWFDYTGNGPVPTDTTSGLRINFSAAAYNGNDFFDASNAATYQNFLFSPDAGYTYCDINSLFLSHYDRSTGLLIPSFFRPQYMPNRRGAPGGFANLYLSASSNQQAMVLRPHQSHVNSGNATISRFVSPGTMVSAQSGDRNRVIESFLFTVTLNGSGNDAGPLSGSTAYEFDADADGDGIRDSIYMDLDHRIVDLPNGRQVMPLYYFKIEDADALLNVNAHGNLNRTPTATDFNNNNLITANRPAHSSNLGLSVSEINPVWALYSNPQSAQFLNPAMWDSVMASHSIMFPTLFGGMAPSAAYSSVSAAGSLLVTSSMEMAMLLKGRVDPSGGGGQQGVPGRWSTFPIVNNDIMSFSAKPGATSTDDDADGTGGGTAGLGGNAHPSQPVPALTQPAYTPTQVQPSFVHPLDYVGKAQYPNTAAANDGTRSLGGTVPTNSPAAWPTYDGNWQYNGTTSYHGVKQLVTSSTSVQTPIAPTPANDGLYDEPNEVILEPSMRKNTLNKVFDTKEMAALHLSENDWYTAGMDSRLRSLLPVNFDASRQASSIRKQFTTDSWDRKEFSYIPYAQRQWEFKDNYGGTIYARFPPSFGAGATQITSRHELAPASINSTDPFRPVVRRLLSVPMMAPTYTAAYTFNNDPAASILTTGDYSDLNISSNGSRRLLPQQKLDLNRLLVHFDPRGNPIYRELTPHPQFLSTDTDNNKYLYDGTAVRPMYHAHQPHAGVALPDNVTPVTNVLSLLEPDIPAVSSFVGCPLSAAMETGADPFAQELWARYDRQRLARDIYVLLAVAGAANGVDPTTTALDPTRAREMAQFAVNCVDAMDRDNVITRFEYDTDLSNGWDDSALSVVYGVESQTLSFAEVLMINAIGTATDRATTLIEEESGTDYRFLYMELRNSSPFPVVLQPDSWRIARVLPGKSSAATLAEVELKGNPRRASGEILPGENFLIATHDGTARMQNAVLPTSDFFIDYENGGELETAVPHSTYTVANNATAPTKPLADLDLAWTGTTPDHASKYEFTKRIAGGTSTLIQPNTGMAPDSPASFDLVLQRKKNLQGEGLDFDHEWVEVDRISIDVANWTTFNPGSDSKADNAEEVVGTATVPAKIISRERRQPLDGRLANNNAATGSLHHTLATADTASASTTVTAHQKNSVLGTARFTLFEPHFDRDFSSVMELLSIPLYGPPNLAAAADFDTDIHGSQSHHFSDTGVASGHFTAMIRFQNPTATYPSLPTNFYANSPPATDNTWYRFFNFVKAGPMEYQFGEQNMTFHRRHPGKINLNTLRHEAVLAGIIDDHVHLDPFLRLTNSLPMTRDIYDTSAGNRDWYNQLQIARDGFDPTLSTGLTVPGLPGATPFQSESFIDTNSTSQIDAPSHTLLKELPLIRNASNVQGFGLMDAREVGDYTGGTHAVDQHTAKRLLAKVANLTTNRSHVFVIHAGYDLFEAHQPTATTVQIGAKAEDLPGRRMLLVVDMSRLEEAYDATTGTFDFRKFIIHRQLLP